MSTVTPSEPEYDVPPVLFAQGRGARLAYQDFGDGPATIVAVPPMAQNIEAAWEWPALREMFGQFGSFSRWIQFDKRGTGSSDRRVRVPGIDERVDDLRAVMDAAGVDRAHLFGQSEGGPMAILFAVTYPQRVESLTLFGTGLAGEVIEAQVTAGVPGQFGYWLMSPNSGLYVTPPGSGGVLCLAAPQRRFNSVLNGEVFQFDSSGVSQTVLSGGPSILRTDGSGGGGGVPAVQPGESMAFQAWHRDVGGVFGNDNFSPSRVVQF